jgi:hypothetical protein
MMRSKSGKRESEKRKPNVGLGRSRTSASQSAWLWGRGPPDAGIRIPFVHSGSSRVPTMSLLDGALLFGVVILQRCQPYGLGADTGRALDPMFTMVLTQITEITEITLFTLKKNLQSLESSIGADQSESDQSAKRRSGRNCSRTEGLARRQGARYAGRRSRSATLSTGNAASDTVPDENGLRLVKASQSKKFALFY